MKKLNRSHGNGEFKREDFKFLGENVIIEDGVKVFHAENISIHDNVYIGHNTILKGYYKNEMIIGENTWIGQNCFFHSAGGLYIGKNVGIGPQTNIITSAHDLKKVTGPILFQPLVFETVTIKDGVDIGVGSTVLPGVTIGENAQIGAMTLVNKEIREKTINVGIPVREIREFEVEKEKE